MDRRGIRETTAQLTTQFKEYNAREIREKIISAISENPEISQRKIANITGLTYNTVRYHMSKMEEEGVLVITSKGAGKGSIIEIK